jgi:hypothetical protein
MSNSSLNLAVEPLETLEAPGSVWDSFRVGVVVGIVVVVALT